jgi:hypothetical protein
VASAVSVPPPRSFAGIHLDGLGYRPGLIGKLGKREPQLIGPHPFGFLPEQPLTEDVQSMAEGRVFPVSTRRSTDIPHGNLTARDVISHSSGLRFKLSTSP